MSSATRCAKAELDALVVVGNGASPRFLKEIGIADADLVVAVTPNDESNVITALAAHQLGARRATPAPTSPQHERVYSHPRHLPRPENRLPSDQIGWRYATKDYQLLAIKDLRYG